MLFRSTGESLYQTLLLREMEGGGGGTFDSGSGNSNDNSGAAAGMLDLGGFSGSVTAVDGSDPSAFGADPNASGSNNGVSNDNGNGGSSAVDLGNGTSVDVSAAGPLSSSNMTFTITDAQVLGAITLGGGVSFGTMGAVAASAATGAAVLGLGVGPVSTAIVDLAHDMSVGLGVAVTSNPSISVFSTYSGAVAAAQTLNANGGPAISANVATPYGGVLVQEAADQQFATAWRVA